MNQPDKKEKLRTKLRKYFKAKSSQKIDHIYYEEPENYSTVILSLISQTIMKTLAAPLLRIRYLQQTAYESLNLRTKRIRFKEAYNRILNRNNNKIALFKIV